MTTATLEPELSASGVGYPTVAALARDWATRHPKQPAMREKDFGIWHEYTWGDVWQTVLDAAHGLLALGVEPGDRVSIHSEDRPEWVILDLATVAVRGITVGLYPTNPLAEVEYLLGDCTPVVHLAEDQEQVDKLVAVSPQASSSVRKVIYLEPRGVRQYDDSRLMAWDELLELGIAHRGEHPGAVEQRMAEATPEDVMTLVYTSGTTGPPKGAMLSNANAHFSIDTIVNLPERVPRGKTPSPDDLIVTYLPLCHVAERIFSTWHLVSCGSVLNFAESIDTINANLREVQPTLFFAVPRIWEKLHAGVLIRASDATWLKRTSLKLGLRMASRVGKAKVANGGSHTFSSRLTYAVGYPFVFRALKERIGLRRCRYAASGAAAIAPEVLEFFIGIGVPVFELYGMTENTAVATANFPGRMKLGTVGEPYPGIGLRLDPETGEIQTKHDGSFVGYWGKPEKTAETFTEDGWLMTGDVGEWVDDTHIKIVDRIKHIIITSGGKNISPSEIENSLKTSPYVKEAMVIGDGKKYLTALVGIELDTVGDWALRKNIPYTTYRDLSEKPEVVELVQGVVDETNEKFASVEQIKAFRMIPKELDHEDGELTATQKLKRSAMAEMFGEVVDEMYFVSATIGLFVAQTDVPVSTGGGDLEKFIDTLAGGLALGSIYALLALSFVLVFKATQAVNFAQGSIALVGTWFLSLLLVDWEIPARWLPGSLDENDYVVWFSSLVAALIMSVILGLVIERFLIRPMIGEPLFAIAVITLGLEAVLRTIGTDAVAINNRSLQVPWGADGFELLGASIPWTFVGAMIAAAVSFVLTFWFFRTRTGIAMRAVAFDQEASLAQGIKVGRVFAIAWGAGAALAVLGAVFYSMVPFSVGTATAATTGLAFRALPAVILGGLDSVPGALVGGLVVGCAEVFAGVYLADYTDTLGVGYQLIVPYIIMLIVLLVRPYGLFGTREIRRV